MEHLSNDPKDHPNQHENSRKQCDETRHPVLSYWKVNGNCDNNKIRIPNGGKAIEGNPKEQDCDSHSHGGLES